MSAPHSIGRHRYGVANVLSTISGRSWSWATAASASMSRTLPAGLPIVSPKNALVFARTAPRHASRSSGSTQVSLTLSLRSRCLSWFTVPPYNADDATTWSPGSSSVNSAAACAAIPLAKATAPTPALEVRDPLLERGDGRIHDPRVGVAVLLQVEVRRGRFGVLEDVARRLEDRHRARARVGVRSLPGVELARLEPERPRLGGLVVFACHGSSARKRRMIRVWLASSSRKQSWPYGASIT